VAPAIAQAIEAIGTILIQFLCRCSGAEAFGVIETSLVQLELKHLV
jgi:hypothetical protein